jgi:hypothetical protein
MEGKCLYILRHTGQQAKGISTSWQLFLVDFSSLHSQRNMWLTTSPLFFVNPYNFSTAFKAVLSLYGVQNPFALLGLPGAYRSSLENVSQIGDNLHVISLKSSGSENVKLN